MGLMSQLWWAGLASLATCNRKELRLHTALTAKPAVFYAILTACGHANIVVAGSFIGLSLAGPLSCVCLVGDSLFGVFYFSECRAGGAEPLACVVRATAGDRWPGGSWLCGAAVRQCAWTRLVLLTPHPPLCTDEFESARSRTLFGVTVLLAVIGAGLLGICGQERRPFG